MDAAPLAHRDTRRCARPGCADVAVATLSFRYDLSQAWVMPLTDQSSPATYDLCGPCADRTKPPRGWHLVDERPDLDASVSPHDEHDVVRAAIAAALRGQTAPLEVVQPVTDAAEAATPPAGVLHAVPDPAPQPAADRASRPRPVEVLISPPVVAEAPPATTPAPPAPAPEAPTALPSTVAGDPDLVAALRDHQDRTAAAPPAPPAPPAALADAEPQDRDVADFFASKARQVPSPTRTVRPVPPPGTMQVPATAPAGIDPESTSAVLATALQEVVAGLPRRSTTAVRGANVPLAFDEVPGRLVSLGLDELGEFDEADLVEGLRNDEGRDLP